MSYAVARPRLGAVNTFWASRGRGRCEVIPARDILSEDEMRRFRESGPGKRGYDPVCDCYCLGYRPPTVVLQGLGAPESGAIYDWNFRVCTSRSHASKAACCGTDGGSGGDGGPQDCPTCPQTTPQGGALGGKWGVRLGWLVAGAALAGGGYYAYKKGAFKAFR